MEEVPHVSWLRYMLVTLEREHMNMRFSDFLPSNEGWIVGGTVPYALLTLVTVFLYMSTSFLFVDVPNRPPGPPWSFLGLKKSTSSSGVHPSRIFAALQHKYGPVLSLYQGRTLVIGTHPLFYRAYIQWSDTPALFGTVLGTIKAASDLLDKRGNIYSSRPRNIMVGELLSGGMRGLSMPYGTRWRNWRSLMHAGMSIEASNGYKNLQSIESKILLQQFLSEKDPEQYSSLFRRFAISIALYVSYGLRVASLDDPVVVANLQTDKCLNRMSVPGRYIVESWPFLLYLPRFMQWFRYEAEVQREIDAKLYTSLLDDVRRRMALGTAAPSTAKRGLEKQEEFGLNDLETAFALSAPFAAGVGTTTAALDVFLLAMLHYPEVMKKAQAEIDAVVGSTRLPEFDDARSLPYVQAVVKETLRWKPIAPMGVPHSVIANDEYKPAGSTEKMYIPKGSTVIPNIYLMSKDEEMFPSADEFKPERYLGQDLRTLKTTNSPHSTFMFGFGRRICPGMHIAQNSLFILIARILWAFDILPGTDGKGNATIPPVDDFIGGLVFRPRPFVYVLKPRKGDDAKPIIREESQRAEAEAETWAAH